MWYNFNHIGLMRALVRLAPCEVMRLNAMVTGEERRARGTHTASPDAAAVQGPTPIRETEGAAMEQEYRTQTPGDRERLDDVDAEVTRR